MNGRDIRAALSGVAILVALAVVLMLVGYFGFR